METERKGKIMHIGQLLPEQLQRPVLLDDIELSQEEIDHALQLAKLEKHVRLENDRKKALAAARLEDINRPWSPKEMWEFARQRGTAIIRERTGDPTLEFKCSLPQVPVVRALSMFFTNNPEFENLDPKQLNAAGLPLSLNKGIWLWGNPGVGKTLLMHMFSRNKRMCYRLLQCPKIVASYNLDGYEAIKQYAKRWPEPPGGSNFFQDQIGICYNDLGTEPMQAKNFGNTVNVMETLFLETYENQVPFHHRHVTTNLSFDQVEQHYGIRVRDRIRESFNIIELGGASMRK
jgi:hypothetical protein